MSMPAGIPLANLSAKVKAFVEEHATLLDPAKVHVCDGSEEEYKCLVQILLDRGVANRLPKLENSYIVRTKKADVARVEKCTFLCTEKKEEAVIEPKAGCKSKLGNWKHTSEMDAKLLEKFTNCMQGRTMYVIPFCMGPMGSPLAKVGIEITDSEYVVVCMRIMTRMGKNILDYLGDKDFTKCVHSIGQPLKPGEKGDPWPCNPENIVIAHFPERNEIKSFGSGYGGNSLLGKKCLALRIASYLAKKEGWLAEHMLILGLTNPKGVKKYICAAFPSQCGKTNLAMIRPSLPGWKAECVGDDIAWMWFDETGQLRAINPENGLFGVAPGTNMTANPNAMTALLKNTVFTNTASTADGAAYWEGLEDEVPKDTVITSWLGQEHWEKLSPEEKKATPAAHPNSRFCTPTVQCPNLDPKWESPEGVPISAILFGGRRPRTIPLVFETFNWHHAIFVGLCMRSEATAAAADHKGKKMLLNDPFAMRPFFGYNMCRYMEHWRELEDRPNVKLPKVFHVNWFRVDDHGEFIWPGFGENIRVLDWVLHRCNEEDNAQETPLGRIPKPGTVDISGLGDIDIEHLFDFSKADLEAEVTEMEAYFAEQLPGQLPPFVEKELQSFKERIAAMK